MQQKCSQLMSRTSVSTGATELRSDDVIAASFIVQTDQTAGAVQCEMPSCLWQNIPAGSRYHPSVYRIPDGGCTIPISHILSGYKQHTQWHIRGVEFSTEKILEWKSDKEFNWKLEANGIDCITSRLQVSLPVESSISTVVARGSEKLWMAS